MTAPTSTREEVVVELARPANDMVQEEIGKRIAHLAREVGQVRFAADGASFSFEAPAGRGEELRGRAEDAARRVQRSLRNLDRAVVFRSRTADHPHFNGDGSADGIRFLGRGQVALQGAPLQLFEYFDRVFTAFGRPFGARPLRVPTLIPVETLAKCDYLKSFPQLLNFVAHLHEDADVVSAFQEQHANRTDLADDAVTQLATPEVGLSPAVCYHAYSMHAGTEIPAGGVTYGMCGKCFRYEGSGMQDMRRLWDFTLREVVFLGTREEVLAERARGVEDMGRFLDAHEVAAEIRTASDPFFVAPDDALAKTYFQLSSDTKYEVAAYLPDGSQLAVGSLNYHGDFFGRTFDCTTVGGAPMHSVCIGFGLERWVHAFLAQHGASPRTWPEVVRTAPEFAA